MRTVGDPELHVRGADGLLCPRERPRRRRHLHDPSQHPEQPGRELAGHPGALGGGLHNRQAVRGDRRLRYVLRIDIVISRMCETTSQLYPTNFQSAYNCTATTSLTILYFARSSNVFFREGSFL